MEKSAETTAKVSLFDYQQTKCLQVALENKDLQIYIIMKYLNRYNICTYTYSTYTLL